MSKADRAVLCTQSSVKFWYFSLQSAKLGDLENNCVSNSHCHLFPSTVFKLTVNYLRSSLIKKTSSTGFQLCLILLFPIILWRTFAWIKQKNMFWKKQILDKCFALWSLYVLKMDFSANKEPVPGLCHVIAHSTSKVKVWGQSSWDSRTTWVLKS